MDTNELTPEASFAIIDKAVSNFKTNYQASAQIFLLWGWVLTLACFSQFAIIEILGSRGEYELIGMYSIGNWVTLGIIAFIIQYFLVRRINKEKKVFTYLEGYLKSLWLVCGISFFIGIVICVQLGVTPPPIMLLIAGIGTTTTGLLIRFVPLTIGGISFFVFSLATAFAPMEYLNLLTGAAIACGHLIPGYLLKSSKG